MRPPPALSPTPPIAARRRIALSLLAWPLAACTLVPQHVADVRDRRIVLLGEVHDNAAQHALRLRAFEALLASGARPSLLMEQFDRERQPALDEARRAPAADVDALIAAAGGSGWDWPHYRPFLALALAHGLPIVAANVSRSDARRIAREGLAAHGFDAAVPDDLLALQAEAIIAGHCGRLGADAARRLALAQIARDQQMARLVVADAARGVVLLAGNGHVRTDAGVPRWLPPALRTDCIAIGLLEEGDDDAAHYDRVWRSPRRERPDPCAGLPLPSG